MVLSGCAGYQAFRQGQADMASGQTETGLAKLKAAVEQNPNNNEFRRSYFTQRENAINTALRDAEASKKRLQVLFESLGDKIKTNPLCNHEQSDWDLCSQ